MSALETKGATAPEQVARFVYEKGHLFSNGTAKWKAFEPSRRDNTTSVFVTDGLTVDETWALGDGVRLQTTIAQAIVTPRDVHAAGLDLQVDNNPPRHAAIVRWPEEKSEVRAMAQELAARAIVRHR